MQEYHSDSAIHEVLKILFQLGSRLDERGWLGAEIDAGHVVENEDVIRGGGDRLEENLAGRLLDYRAGYVGQGVE